jgi:two-component system sensor histidine kinase HydH
MTTTADQGNNTAGEFLRKYGLALAMILVISALHYLTPHGGGHEHAGQSGTTPWWANLHGIYRRLYYFPIILAAFRGGPRGGEMAALLVIALYIPHATGRIGHDPGSPTEKFLEMGLYLGVGMVTGILVGRINAARIRLQATAEDLQAALDEKTVMEAELVRSARLAAVGRLSAGLAHEIRNPLASIQGSAEVLGDDYPPEHPKGGMFRIMLEETARLNQVLTRFLAYARSEPGDRAPFDLGAEAQAVQQLLALQPDTPALQISGQTDVKAIGDPEQIRQVLLNLALNAAAAAGPEGEVELVLERTGNFAHCQVLDSGPGFSAEAVENFGTPFFSTKHEGTGLGLATSLRIVEDLGGTLQIDPDQTSGGSIVLTLAAADTP